MRWDTTYTDRRPGSRAELPVVFAPFAEHFPRSGAALELACGTGSAAVWLAARGLVVWGLDISNVAIDQARERAARHGVWQRCRFSAVDLDDGLPPGRAVDIVLCHRFRDPHLYSAIADRLAPGGVLAICVLSEVGAAPGRFRAAAGELTTAFHRLQPIAADEAAGQAWLLARAPESDG